MASRSFVVFLAIALATPVLSGTLAQFRTVFGDIEVELYDQDKPITVGNFIRYVREGRYTNSIFHRATYPPQVLVIQGGGVWISNRSSGTNFGLFSVPVFSPITNEFQTGTQQSNVYGTIAMAKTSDPNSATSQFFFNLTNNSAALDNTNNSGGFAVFGRTIRGTNVLNKLNASHPQTGIFRANLGAGLPEVPLLSTFSPPLDAEEFVYVDVSLLAVQVVVAIGNGRAISWNSIAGLTNLVEYTIGFPPSWQPLVTTNGNGSRLTVVDPAADPKRFYRVRVDY